MAATYAGFETPYPAAPYYTAQMGQSLTGVNVR